MKFKIRVERTHEHERLTFFEGDNTMANLGTLVCSPAESEILRRAVKVGLEDYYKVDCEIQMP